jgi:Family of unknown function (DUF6573)
LFGEAEVIHCYGRADAIADGILIDVTDTAKTDYTGHGQAGRLWDVLFMTPGRHPAPSPRRPPARVCVS